MKTLAEIPPEVYGGGLQKYRGEPPSSNHAWRVLSTQPFGNVQPWEEEEVEGFLFFSPNSSLTCPQFFLSWLWPHFRDHGSTERRTLPTTTYTSLRRAKLRIRLTAQELFAFTVHPTGTTAVTILHA